MATLLSALETQVRYHLHETTASFWTSVEIVAHLNSGIKDLYRAIVDLGQEHFLTVDATNVSQAASATTLTGVPADVYKVYLVEPRDISSTTSNQGLIYRPKDYNDPEFVAARSLTDQDPTNRTVLFAIVSAGAPVAAPTIYVAPTLDTAVNLRLVYVPVVATKVAANDNPIPGESDNALIAWAVAFARAKEREEASPDPEWLAIYATEKQNILTSLTPRQTQEPDVVPAFLEAWDYLG